MSELQSHDLASERWREYDFGGRVYRIDAPRMLYSRDAGTTHRVLDGDGTMHLVPAPGSQGCVVRWQPRNPDEPVQF